MSRAARETQRKLNHSIIEKARRTKINDALATLRQLVPSDFDGKKSDKNAAGDEEDDEEENDEDAITPMDELNDREFLDVILSTFPTEFPGERDVYDDEDGVGVADYDPELHDLRQRTSAVSMQEARQEVLSDSEKDIKTSSHSRTRAKSLSSLISNPAQTIAVQELRRPLPSIPVVRISQHN